MPADQRSGSAIRFRGKTRSFFPLIPVAVLLAACNTATVPTSNASPAGLPAIDDPQSAVVVIYSHGTTRPQRLENCGAQYNQPPSTLTDLTGGQSPLIVHFLCSRARDEGVAGSYIYKRADEIGDTVGAFAQAGVPAANIYLAGHSAGAWSSLMYMSEHAETVAGAVLFAPACCGPRHEIDDYPIWRTEIRPQQVSEIAGGDTLDALVFAYTDDAFNRPQELAFLTDAYSQTVTLVSQSCGAGHATFRQDCNANATRSAIADYLGL